MKRQPTYYICLIYYICLKVLELTKMLFLCLFMVDAKYVDDKKREKPVFENKLFWEY